MAIDRVAVIGAGAAGLASARWLIEAGLEPAVFERTGAVGGLWRPDTGLAYPSLRTNTSKQKTAFSDLAFGRGARRSGGPTASRFRFLEEALNATARTAVTSWGM